MTPRDALDSLPSLPRPEFGPLERRAFMRGTLLGAVALAGAQSGCAVPPPRGGVATPHLSDLEAAVFERLIPVLLPIDGTVALLPPDRVPVLANIDAMIARVPDALRQRLGMAIRLFAWGSLPMGLRLRTFPELDDGAAGAYCAAWHGGGAIRRNIMRVLAQVTYVAYWREPATWAPLGYEGPVTARYGIARQGNSPRPDAT